LINVGYFRKNNPKNARTTLGIDPHLWGKINGEKHLWGKMSFGEKCYAGKNVVGDNGMS